MDYLFKMSDPITPRILASAAVRPSQPRIIEGEDEDGIAEFCQISELDIPKIKEWLVKTYPTVRPVFAPINKARKALLPICAYPTLGYDTTLPHRRPKSSPCFEYLPIQDQYPVWYFFYGTLADSSFLAELFGSSREAPMLLPAVIHGGRLRTWVGSTMRSLIIAWDRGSMDGRTRSFRRSRKMPCACMRLPSMRW